MDRLMSILVREGTWKRAYWWAIRILLLFCLFCLARGMWQFVEWLASSDSFLIMFHD